MEKKKDFATQVEQIFTASMNYSQEKLIEAMDEETIRKFCEKPIEKLLCTDRSAYSSDFGYYVKKTIAEQVATKYVDEHYTELIKLIDLDAIKKLINLGIAERTRQQ